MSSILSWVALSLGGRDEVVGPDGFFARTGSMSLWMEDVSVSSFLKVWANFCRTVLQNDSQRHSKQLAMNML